MLQPWPDGTRWLACHLFFNHPGIYTGECDGVILELAEPFVRRVRATNGCPGRARPGQLPTGRNVRDGSLQEGSRQDVRGRR